MTVEEAVKVLDGVIPAPDNPMVDLEHLDIAIAWKAIKDELNKPRFKLEISTGNAAFHDEMTGEADVWSEALEVTRIMNEVRSEIRNGRRSGHCFDYNGNPVGRWDFRG